MIENLLIPIRDDLFRVEEILKREAASGVASADVVARHVIESGGKRIRPAIFLLAVRSLGLSFPPGLSFPRNLSPHVVSGERESLLPEIAAAFEMVHTASLLHDDVIDEGRVRRGKESANAQFGNGPSVLVGDFLWCAASRLIIGAGMQRLTDAVVDAVRATAVGALLEIECRDNGKASRDTWLKVIDGKTAELFALCARAGAIVVNADARYEDALARYGRSVGMAFQLADDALDANCGPLGSADLAIKLARQYAAEAKEHISIFPSSIERDSLMGLADYAADREF